MNVSVRWIMGNYLQDYRLAIGMFNRVKFCQHRFAIRLRLISVSLLILSFVFLLLLLCGDIEQNPGPTKLKSLSVCHINIRGLNDNKLRAIKTSLTQVYDIITISETFLSERSGICLDIKEFNPILRRDRDTFGVGVAVYIKENIVYKRHVQFESKDLENIWIEVKTKEGTLLICTLYRPPNYNEFWDHFESNIEFVKTESLAQNIMVIGDINADFNTVNGTKLLDICSVQNLHCHINSPTRITSTSSSCLDQVLSNIPNFISQVIIEPPVSTNDHNTIGVRLSFQVYKEKSYHSFIWLYDKGNYECFRTCLNNVDWDYCFENDDVDIAYSRWSEKLL